MKAQIKALADIDPLRVPLPHGTEVTTRVDRTVGERVVKQGAVGRVTALSANEVKVQIVGVGQVSYSRSELTPRKSGQLAYAIRREAAWQALKPNIVLETVVGSRAWGLEEQGSDTDLRGVFVLPFPWTTGLVEPPSDLVSVDGSSNYWEVSKALRQAIRADPNTLETLLLPGATATDEMGAWIIEAREAFVSIEIYGTFGRYALSQLKRLRQGMRLAEHRVHLLQWLQHDSSLSLDQAALRLVDEAGVEAPTQKDKELRAKDYVKQLYSSMYDQGLLGARDFASLVSFANEEKHEFELPRELRPKNAYNLLRLLATATSWLRSGTPDFVVKGELREELMAVKRQELPLSEIIARAEALASELEDARSVSSLPTHPDVGRIDSLLRRVRQESARRWHEGAAGPFGSQAAILPLVEWE